MARLIVAVAEEYNRLVDIENGTARVKVDTRNKNENGDILAGGVEP